jgi:hypothetical protein
VRILNSIEEVISKLQADRGILNITLFPPATQIELNNFEKCFNLKLPEDVKQLYQFANGFESKEDLFRIIPLQEIIERKKQFTPSVFFIAEYLQYSDMWEIAINKSILNDYTIASYSEGLILTKSISEFICHFLEGGIFEKNGIYDWQDQVKEIKS